METFETVEVIVTVNETRLAVVAMVAMVGAPPGNSSRTLCCLN